MDSGSGEGDLGKCGDVAFIEGSSIEFASSSDCDLGSEWSGTTSSIGRSLGLARRSAISAITPSTSLGDPGSVVVIGTSAAMTEGCGAISDCSGDVGSAVGTVSCVMGSLAGYTWSTTFSPVCLSLVTSMGTSCCVFILLVGSNDTRGVRGPIIYVDTQSAQLDLYPDEQKAFGLRTVCAR